jgi:serine/threonine protein kinase
MSCSSKSNITIHQERGLNWLLQREFASKDLRSVGNYSLGRLIGKGSFGKVYLATHKLTNGSKVGRHITYFEEHTADGELGRFEICE